VIVYLMIDLKLFLFCSCWSWRQYEASDKAVTCSLGRCIREHVHPACT